MRLFLLASWRISSATDNSALFRLSPNSFIKVTSSAFAIEGILLSTGINRFVSFLQVRQFGFRSTYLAGVPTVLRGFSSIYMAPPPETFETLALNLHSMHQLCIVVGSPMAFSSVRNKRSHSTSFSCHLGFFD